MIQVRCPDCGYLQTLSEERFLSIPENFLNCPHCHAQVPKQWVPTDSEAVPEEVRHKIMAFSRRILSGREVGREILHALESLVHRYGAMDQCNKALGIGYASLGERKKAEEFLVQAKQETPNDPEILRCLLEILLTDERSAEAVLVGRSLVQAQKPRAEDEDVARLALALIGIGNIREAKELMDSHPGLDSRNPVVKQARKHLNRGTGSRLGAFFRDMNPLQRLMDGAGKQSLKTLGKRARNLVGAVPGLRDADRSRDAGRGAATATATEPGITSRRGKLPAVLEYWIYAPGLEIPQWEQVRHRLAESQAGTMEKDRTFSLLESLLSSNDLTLEYILRQEAQGLFDYPEELIPCNGREIDSRDRKYLKEAQMIVRLRLTLKEFSGTEYLNFMVRFVEAVRSLSHGIVQDAVSHILWGTPEWKAHSARPSENLIESHVLFEIIDEGETVWIHSHGMQKLGLPDLEMEDVPSDLASAGRDLMIMATESLLSKRDRGLDFQTGMKIFSTPFSFALEARPRDEEGHFPAGSLRILPHMADYDHKRPDAVRHVLKMLTSQDRSHVAAGRRSGVPEADTAQGDRSDSKVGAMREKFLTAHKKAVSELSVFKKSFQTAKDPSGQVHAVKVGFPVPGGSYEWMWVSLESWRGNSLAGRLENVPTLRKDLQKGGTVQISEAEIFDWVITRGGSVMKGAFTEEAAST